MRDAGMTFGLRVAMPATCFTSHVSAGNVVKKTPSRFAYVAVDALCFQMSPAIEAPAPIHAKCGRRARLLRMHALMKDPQSAIRNACNTK